MRSGAARRHARRKRHVPSGPRTPPRDGKIGLRLLNIGTNSASGVDGCGNVAGNRIHLIEVANVCAGSSVVGSHGKRCTSEIRAGMQRFFGSRLQCYFGGI
jgi:hypothetical protein